MKITSAATAVLVAGLAAAPASADIGPFTGVGTGLNDQYHHTENADRTFHSDSKHAYTGRFTYSFRIDAFGTVTGRGDGVYQSARWRLDGRNYDDGTFGCDVPVTTTPNYEVDITGRVQDRRLHLMFSLNGAEESNEDQDCGANYKANATRTTYLATSLRAVQRDELVLDADRPVIGPLRLLEETGEPSNRRVILHEWDISLRVPDRPQDTGPNAPPGFGDRPQRGDSSICTIEGTGRADRLNGTRRNDVICGYGGNDRINGRGGHDLVYAGPGNDRVKGAGGLDTLYGNFGNDSFATRDGKRDKAHGGVGKDSAAVDRRDRTTAVERVSRR